MALSCGCELRPGLAVTPEMLQSHLVHTMEALVFWELIRRPSRDPMATLPMAERRIKVIEEIERLYPESKQGE